MRDKLKNRGFEARVPDKADKEAVCSYLNEELERYIQMIEEKDKKVKDWYDAEKTRIRRTVRQ